MGCYTVGVLVDERLIESFPYYWHHCHVCTLQPAGFASKKSCATAALFYSSIFQFSSVLSCHAMRDSQTSETPAPRTDRVSVHGLDQPMHLFVPD
jgi:hypothetical protein